jgi:predicted NUDIX family NTP pyrophosphohydrolase
VAKQSAGLLMLRIVSGTPQFLLAHPGGPYFVRKDEGTWTIPKGLIGPGESMEAAACREFAEETGFEAPSRDRLVPLGNVKQKGGKIVHAFAFFGDCDPARLSSNIFELEWPPRSGRLQRYAEIDRVEFFDAAAARAKILEAQRPFIDRALRVVRWERG